VDSTELLLVFLLAPCEDGLELAPREEGLELGLDPAPRDVGRDDDLEPGRDDDLEPGRDDDLEPGRDDDREFGRFVVRDSKVENNSLPNNLSSACRSKRSRFE